MSPPEAKDFTHMELRLLLSANTLIHPPEPDYDALAEFTEQSLADVRRRWRNLSKKLRKFSRLNNSATPDTTDSDRGENIHAVPEPHNVQPSLAAINGATSHPQKVARPDSRSTKRLDVENPTPATAKTASTTRTHIKGSSAKQSSGTRKAKTASNVTTGGEVAERLTSPSAPLPQASQVSSHIPIRPAEIAPMDAETTSRDPPGSLKVIMRKALLAAFEALTNPGRAGGNPKLQSFVARALNDAVQHADERSEAMTQFLSNLLVGDLKTFREYLLDLNLCATAGKGSPAKNQASNDAEQSMRDLTQAYEQICKQKNDVMNGTYGFYECCVDFYEQQQALWRKFEEDDSAARTALMKLSLPLRRGISVKTRAWEWLIKALFKQFKPSEYKKLKSSVRDDLLNGRRLRRMQDTFGKDVFYLSTKLRSGAVKVKGGQAVFGAFLTVVDLTKGEELREIMAEGGAAVRRNGKDGDAVVDFMRTRFSDILDSPVPEVEAEQLLDRIRSGELEILDLDEDGDDADHDESDVEGPRDAYLEDNLFNRSPGRGSKRSLRAKPAQETFNKPSKRGPPGDSDARDGQSVASKKQKSSKQAPTLHPTLAGDSRKDRKGKSKDTAGENKENDASRHLVDAMEDSNSSGFE